MRRLLRPTPGRIAALVSAGIVIGTVAVTGGQAFSPGDLNADVKGGARLGGVASHAEIAGNCSACHVPPWSSQVMADRCLGCHADVNRQIAAHEPLHGRLSDVRQCRGCHTEHQGPHAALTDMSRFDHDCAAFRLTGKHRSVECRSCHVNNVFKGTAQVCVSCHAEPKKHLGMFGTDCARCHATDAWQGVSLEAGSFDHDRTAFRLTGMHKTVECRACHINNVFKGTSQACVSCHAEPKKHLGKLGTDCAKCHSTTTWEGATFKHTFPLNHGRRNRGNSDCATCHKDSTNYKVYTCYGCHEHEPARIARKHRKFRDFENCVRCHANGREHDRRGNLGGREATLCLASPGACPNAGLEDLFPENAPCTGDCPGHFLAGRGMERPNHGSITAIFRAVIAPSAEGFPPLPTGPRSPDPDGLSACPSVEPRCFAWPSDCWFWPRPPGWPAPASRSPCRATTSPSTWTPPITSVPPASG